MSKFTQILLFLFLLFRLSYAEHYGMFSYTGGDGTPRRAPGYHIAGSLDPDAMATQFNIQGKEPIDGCSSVPQNRGSGQKTLLVVTATGCRIQEKLDKALEAQYSGILVVKSGSLREQVRGSGYVFTVSAYHPEFIKQNTGAITFQKPPGSNSKALLKYGLLAMMFAICTALTISGLPRLESFIRVRRYVDTLMHPPYAVNGILTQNSKRKLLKQYTTKIDLSTIDEDGEDACVVCFREWKDGESAIALRCGHVFCKKCAKDWHCGSNERARDLCAFCRQHIDANYEERMREMEGGARPAN